MNRETTIGGHKVTIRVPDSVEEFDQLAKKSGACLEAATDYEVFHGTLGDIRNALVSLIEKTYETPRRDIGTGKFEEVDGKREEITKPEGFEVFLNRVAAEKGLTSETPFQDLADRLSVNGDKEVKFDPSVQARRPGVGPKLPKYATEMATNFLEGRLNPATGKSRDIHRFATAYKKATGNTLDVASLPTEREAYIKALGEKIVEYRNSLDIPS